MRTAPTAGRCAARVTAAAGLFATTALAGEPIEDPFPPIAESSVRVQLETVATGLTAPNWATALPGHPGRLVVVDQDGILWNIGLGDGSKSVMLDVSGMIVPLGAFGEGSFDERGLLGVAFHPDYATNGLLYTYTSEPDSAEPDFSTMPAGVDPNHQTVVREWAVFDPADAGTTVDPASARELLRIDQPQFNHNAGCLNFGPDGMLYIALGDGGAADDTAVGHSPQGNGQDPTNPLGAVLRIDPLGDNGVNGAYGVPGDNPFIDEKQFPGWVDEIHSYGFRNPFRFSFDMLTGALWLADVGQNDIEEVDVVVSGGNYGWNWMEGSFFFDPNGSMEGFITETPRPGTPGGLLLPEAEYDHDEGIAIVGGFVYRGPTIHPLRGLYVFGEFARTFSNDGRLFHLDVGSEIVELIPTGGPLNLSLLGMGQDAAGELYVLANATGTPFEETGVVLRIAVRPGDLDADGDIDFDDLGLLLGAFGESGDGDIDGDGDTDFDDLGVLLGAFGA